MSAPEFRGSVVKLNVFPSAPAGSDAVIPADPVEVLAFALWNEGKEDEALAVLERQIELEKKLARTPLPENVKKDLGRLPVVALPAVVQAMPKPTTVASPAAEPAPTAAAPEPAHIPPQAPSPPPPVASPAELALPSPASVAGSQIAVAAAVLPPERHIRRPFLKLAAVMLVVGGLGYWLGQNGSGPDATEQSASITGATAPVAANPPTEANSDQAALQNPPPDESIALPEEYYGEVVPEEGAAVTPPAELPPEPTSPPETSGDIPEEPVPPEIAEDVPQDSVPPEAVEVAPSARLPRSRAEPPAPPAPAPSPAQTTRPAEQPRAVAAPAPRAAPKPPARTSPPPASPPPAARAARETPAPASPPETARNAAPARQAAPDARTERARRLAERREAAERYVARRRAEAERRAGGNPRRTSEARPSREPVRGDDGPSILLGGRTSEARPSREPVRGNDGPSILLGGRGLPD